MNFVMMADPSAQHRRRSSNALLSLLLRLGDHLNDLSDEQLKAIAVLAGLRI